MQTEEQAKLTLALIEVELKWLESDHDDPKSRPPLLDVDYPTTLRALLALDTALRNGCQGCKEGLKSARQQGTDAWMHFGNWSEDGPGTYRWANCKLTEEQRAALLDQGEGDAS